MVERKCPSLNLSNLGGILEKVWSDLSLSVDLGYQTKKVMLIQINSERYGLVCFCSWVEIKLTRLAPLRVGNPAGGRHFQIDQF
jgi:hypothetical protein